MTTTQEHARKAVWSVLNIDQRLLVIKRNKVTPRLSVLETNVCLERVAGWLGQTSLSVEP